VTATGDAVLPGTFRLNNVLVAPNIIKNLISVRQLTTDKNCFVEFDPFGLSVKDLHSRNEIIRCNSSGPLYSLMPPAASSSSCALIAAAPAAVWHRRLGHPGHEALFKLSSVSAISCTHHSSDQLCHACQLGRHIRLPFANSSSRALKNFDLIHSDLWTSPIKSVSGYKYYLVILDDHSHFLWTFPLRLKSETFSTLANFFSYVTTQFGCTIKNVQCDNGREFDNSSARFFFLTHGVCPVLTPPPKTGRLNAFFAPLTILCAPFSSKLPCLLPTGLKAFTLPLIY